MVFPEVVLVLGRRAGKGLIAAIALAYFVTRHVQQGDPRIRLGLPGNKPLVVQIFASDADQATDTVFAEMVGLLRNCDHLAPYLAAHPPTSDRITLSNPATGEGWIEVRGESTRAGGARGVDGIAVIGDEFAHVGTPNTSTDADILIAAEPALMSAGVDRLLMLTSTPNGPQGEFHDRYLQATRVGVSKTFVLQLPSWGLDVGVDRATGISQWVEGPRFQPTRRASFSSKELEERQLADPRSFAQEYEAQFVSVDGAVFTEDHIATMFDERRWEEDSSRKPVDGEVFVHVDPAFDTDRFAWVVGRLAYVQDVPVLVVVEAQARSPKGVSGGLDHDEMVDELAGVIMHHRPRLMTFDQHEARGLIAALGRRSHLDHLLPELRKRPASSSLNARMLEAALGAARQRQVFIDPSLTELRRELEVLQRVGTKPQAPASGAVTTDDMAIALLNVIHLVLDPSEGVFRALRNVKGPVAAGDRDTFAQLSGFGRAVPTSTDPSRVGVAAARAARLRNGRSRP